MNNPGDVIQQTQVLISQGQLTEAKELLLGEFQKNNANPGILLGLGVVSAGEGDFIGSEKWLGMAADAAPNHPGVHMHLAKTLSQLHKREEAIAHYQMAISINPELFEAHLFLAGLLLEQKDLEDAEHHFKCAIKINPGNPDCHANLAQLYELLHKLDDARDAANKAIQLQGNHIGALMLMGKLEKREKNYTEAEKIFREILTTATDESLIATINIELGHVLDKMAQYDLAWNAFSSGKQAWKNIAANIPFDREEYQKLIQQNTQLFGRSAIKQSSKAVIPDNPRLSPIFFVGFPRSGTTLTEQILAQHPDTVTSNEQPFLKETIEDISTILDTSKPFPESLMTASSKDIEKLREAYWRRAEAGLDALQEDSVLIDKLPLNIVNLGYVSMIFPDARILVAIRDPRDVCLSGYMQSFQLNPAMINFFDMDSTVAFYTQVMGLWLHYRSVLPIYWHQYRYEDLVDDFSKTTQDIFAFLGLDLPEDVDKFHETARNKFIDTPSYQDVTTPVYNRSVARWKNYENHTAAYFDRLAPYIDEFGY